MTKTFTVRLQAMCTNKTGIYLWAYTRDRTLFLGRPMAPFGSMSTLEAACNDLGLASCECGIPDSSIEWELSAEQLRGLGFKLKGSVLEWMAMSSAHAVSSGAALEQVHSGRRVRW